MVPQKGGVAQDQTAVVEKSKIVEAELRHVDGGEIVTGAEKAGNRFDFVVFEIDLVEKSHAQQVEIPAKELGIRKHRSGQSVTVAGIRLGDQIHLTLQLVALAEQLAPN